MASAVACLPPEKALAFKKFKTLCAERGSLQRPAALTEVDTDDGITDDSTLIRFLRARKYNEDDAYKQLTEFEVARKLYPHWCGRLDKRGQPICIFDLSTLDNETIASYKLSRAPKDGNAKAAPLEALRSIVFHEHLVRFVLPLCSAVTKESETAAEVTSCIYLVDISTFGWRQAWNLKEYAQDISRLLANNYPEVIDRVFVIGAPGYFSRIWSFLKSWVDPATAAKIVFLAPKEVIPTLSSHIEMEDIPVRFGGKFDYHRGMLPVPNEAIKRKLGWDPANEGTLPAGPLKWVVEGDGVRRAVAVGTIEGKLRSEKFAEWRTKGIAKDESVQVDVRLQSVEGPTAIAAN